MTPLILTLVGGDKDEEDGFGDMVLVDRNCNDGGYFDFADQH